MSRQRRDATGGYMLVTVLAVMILVSGVVAATSYFVRSALDSAKATDGQLTLDGLIHAGLELSAYRLFAGDGLEAVQKPTRLRLKDGTVTGKILDEGGKIDLNGADPALIEAVFKSTGMGAGDITEVMSRVMAMRGPTRDKPAPAPGAPSQLPPSQILPSQVLPSQASPTQVGGAAAKPTRGFQSVGELAAFPGVTARDMELIAPLLTVYNPGGKIDAVTASGEVLSVVPGLSDARVAEILQKRDGASPDELKALVGTDNAYLTTTPGPAYTIQIEATSGSGQRKSARVVVTKSNDTDEPYDVVARWD